MSDLSPLDEATVCNFLSRMHALQRLCSDADTRYPCGLLFIPGPDGKHNKGSLNILKYLFHGATGKYLLDGTIEASFEDLEECVLLVQQSSVSIFWNAPAKKMIGSLLRKVPFLMEYSPSAEEEDEVDKFQMRKCEDFKRMMLEAVPAGRGVGIPVPLGYEDLNEIETWPLLQAFALDSVLCPTGFFTARYVVADVTEYLDVMFRAVDGFAVSCAVDVLRKSIVPHMDQFLGMLDTVTADQRSRLTTEEVLGPLDMLFDFGELECAFPCDPAKKPMLLFGHDTAKFGQVDHRYMEGRAVGADSLHTVVEACEPSCGLRWCRTYFLHHGKAVQFLPFHQIEDQEESLGLQHLSVDCSVGAETAHSVNRLQTVYNSLVISLRAVVMSAFANNVDVFDAGTFIQKAMDDMLKGLEVPEGGKILSEAQARVSALVPGEWLQLHMDCMNALGEVIGIEDVDDMGGSCLMYIRASVHGVALPNKRVGSVAVGDTFLFSVNSGRLLDNSTINNAFKALQTANNDSTLHPHVGDCFCMTSVLPYFRAYVGCGAEEASAQRLLSLSRNPHLLTSLGLGKMIEVLTVGTLSVPILTDNKIMPFSLSSDIRVFSEGFIIEKLDSTCLPILISANIHIAELWVVDAAEALSQALQFAQSRSEIETLPDFYSPNGNLMIFRIKNFHQKSHNNDTDTARFDEHELAIRNALHSNPLANALPFQDNCEFISFFIPTGSRSAQVLGQCTTMWRSVLHASDVPIHRGSDSELPESILKSYLALLEKWSYNCDENFKNTVLDERSPISPEVFISVIQSTGSSAAFKSLARVPALGFLPLKCVHAYSESIRMRADGGHEEGDQRSHSAATHSDMILVSGLSGSGVTDIGCQIFQRLRGHSSMRSRSVLYHYIDISLYAALDPNSEKMGLLNYIRSSLQSQGRKGAEKQMHVVVVVQSPIYHIQQVQLSNIISALLHAKVGTTISVLSPKCFNISKAVRADPSKSVSDNELWRASHVELCQEGLASMVVFIDDSHGKESDVWKAWMISSNPSVSVIRVNAHLLRLEDDFIDDLVDTFSSKKESHTVNKIVEYIRLSRGYFDAKSGLDSEDSDVSYRKSSYGENISQSQVTYRHVCLRPSTAESFWDVSNLLKSLQLIFPTAAVNSSTVQNTWSPPEPSSTSQSWWQRCIQIARVKALTNMRVEKCHDSYDQWRSAFLSSQLQYVQELRERTFSIHGFYRVSKGEVVKGAASKSSPVSLSNLSNCTWVHVEANSGNIIIRALDSASTSMVPLDLLGSDMLVATGLYKDLDISVLDKLFTASEQITLQPLPLLQRGDLTHSQLLSIQATAHLRPLTGGYWYDGTGFVDIHGARRELRPDIEQLAQEYLQERNSSIRAYNNIIEECAPFI